MRLIVINSGPGNYKYRSGYKISEKLLKEFETIYFINPLDIQCEIIEKRERSIEEFYKELEEKEYPFVSVGGDHSVTAYLYKGGKLLVFDAHPDLAFHTGRPTNEDWLRFLIENDKIEGENVFLIGIRNFSRSELEFIREKKINTLFSYEIRDADEIREFIGKGEFYVSIDVDVFDPAFSPGTFYREPFGLDPKTILEALEDIEILSADITEVNLDFDDGKTIRLAAYLSVLLWKKIVFK